MEARITFRAEIYIKGRSANDIQDKFENIELFSNEAKKHGIDYIETVSAERVDDGSYQELF